MKRLLLSVVAAGAALCANAAAPQIEVHSIAQDFVTFWDATQTMPQPERIAAFKRQVASRFPEFYGIERYDGGRTQEQQDRLIGRALADFGPQRQAYLDKVAGFNADLPRYTASFAATFTDFRPQTETWFLHSLGEMDGGTREFKGRSYLIFGADMMSVVHGKGDESAFFHHELFHIHQDAVSPECPDQGMWQPLWREGLATYVSKVMNPAATEGEMLLEFPKDTLIVTKTHLRASLEDLEKVLDNGDDKYYGPLFSTRKDDTGLAPRRGYYLGYLVAREIGTTRDLPTMAKLSCSEAHILVIDAVRKLKQQSHDAAAN
jgi:hypothetical protein